MMTDPLVLVTGASGYLGTHLIKVLQDAGYRVRGTVRSTKNEKNVENLYNLCPRAKFELELVEANLSVEDGWNEAVAGCTYVHHVASPFPLQSPEDENDVIKPAVEGTLNVLMACRAAKTVKRVVLTSSLAAITNAGGNLIKKTETDWADTEYPNCTPYCKSKILAERAAWDFIKQLPDEEKFELAVINPVFIVGPPLQSSPGASSEIIKKLLEREMLMVPRFNFSMVDVRDVALSHFKCMTLPEAAGHRHIVFSESMWMKEMAMVLSREFESQGYRCPTKELPGCLITILSCFNKDIKVGAVTNLKPTLIDNSRMTQVLGITPIKAEQSLVDMAYCMIDKGFAKKTAQYRGREQSL